MRKHNREFNVGLEKTQATASWGCSLWASPKDGITNPGQSYGKWTVAQGSVPGGENALLSGLTYRPSDSKKCGLVTKVPLRQGSNCQWLAILRVAELVSHLPCSPSSPSTGLPTIECDKCPEKNLPLNLSCIWKFVFIFSNKWSSYMQQCRKQCENLRVPFACCIDSLQHFPIIHIWCVFLTCVCRGLRWWWMSSSIESYFM